MVDGDIAINSTGTGTLGRVGIYHAADNPTASPIVPDSHVTVIRPFDEFDSFFFYATMKASQSILEKKGEGSTNQKELKPQTLKDILMPIPPVAEQNRISLAIISAFAILTRIEEGLN